VTEAEPAFLVLPLRVLREDGEEKGKQRVVQAQERVEAEQECEDSFAPPADNEQAAYAQASMRVCSLRLPVPDATGR